MLPFPLPLSVCSHHSKHTAGAREAAEGFGEAQLMLQVNFPTLDRAWPLSQGRTSTSKGQRLLSQALPAQTDKPTESETGLSCKNTLSKHTAQWKASDKGCCTSGGAGRRTLVLPLGLWLCWGCLTPLTGGDAMSTTLCQVMGFLVSSLGVVGCIMSTAMDMWSTQDLYDNPVTAVFQYQGLWRSCVRQSSGFTECRPYFTILGLPGRAKMHQVEPRSRSAPKNKNSYLKTLCKE